MIILRLKSNGKSKKISQGKKYKCTGMDNHNNEIRHVERNGQATGKTISSSEKGYQRGSRNGRSATTYETAAQSAVQRSISRGSCTSIESPFEWW